MSDAESAASAWVSVPETYLEVRLGEHVPVPEDAARGIPMEEEDDENVWSGLVRAFPGTRVRPKITCFTPEELTALQVLARKRDPRFVPRDLSLGYIVVTPDETEALEVESWLKQNALVFRSARPVRRPRPPSTVPSDPRWKEQTYLQDAPLGIGAIAAWDWSGAQGQGVRIADVEFGWQLKHQDLVGHAIPGILNDAWNDKDEQDHGTQVLGVICATADDVGCIGIAPCPSEVHVSSAFGASYADAILWPLLVLWFGDVLVIELQAYVAGSWDWVGPVEMEEDLWQIIRLLTALGVVVVEAAGNGDNASKGLEVDDYLPRDPGTGDLLDSGAILVAAGKSAQQGGGNVIWTPVDTSNYGGRVDCFAQGECVLAPTADTGASTDKYMSVFGGTSAATAIVAGAAVALQGVSKALCHSTLWPDAMRRILSDPSTGTPSAWGAIGVMPNLPAAIKMLLKEYGSEAVSTDLD